MDHAPKTAVLIPYKERVDMLARCLEALLDGAPADVTVLLVDDGSTSPQDELAPYLDDPRVRRLRHETSRGPAAARNTGIAWCRAHGVELLLLLDSDCIPEPGFVEAHAALHREQPDVHCIGGAIRGVGRGLWAHLDRVASWFTSIPGAPPRDVGGVYHIPTTNIGLKLDSLPMDDPLFDETLRTGEDVAFVNRLRAAGGRARFSPTPTVTHLDRENARDFLRHQYRWGRHTYPVRFGTDAPAAQRLAVALVFLALLPAYSLAAATLTVLPWVRVAWINAVYWPALVVLFIYKGLGVLDGILRPHRALYPRQ